MNFRGYRAALYGSAWLCLTSLTPCAAAAPTLSWFFPAGGPRGEAFEVTAGGDPGGWPVEVWCDTPGVKLTALEEKGKFRVESTAEALPGVYWLRLTNAEGASDLRPLVLDQLPEIAETEPNDGPPEEAAKEAPKDADKTPADTAKEAAPQQIIWGQAVDLPVTVNGRFGKGGDVDSFSFTLEPGQTVVARLQAQTVLGSPVDSILQIAELVQQPTSSASPLPPRTEAYVVEQNHDAHGLDPQLEFRAERAGTYAVRAFGFPSDPNSTIGFTGGEALIYRLTITTGGIVDHALPLVIQNTASTDAATPDAATLAEVRLFGAGLAPEGIAVTPQSTATAIASADKPVATETPATETPATETPATETPATETPAAETPAAEAAPAAEQTAEAADSTNRWRAFAPGLPGVAELAAVERGTRLIPGLPAGNAAFADALEVPLPIVASGRLAAAGEVGAVRFTTSKGAPLRITLESRALGFPLDPVVVVRDAEGKALETKDAGRNRGDVSFEFSPPADGQYAVEVQDLHRRGGLRFVYRLMVEPATPDYALTLKENRFVLKPGGTVEIPVAIERRSKFERAITVRCSGLPEGVEAEAVVSEGKGDTAKEVKLVLRGAEGMEPGYGGTVRVEGTAEGAPSSGQPATFTLAPPFAGTHSAVWLTVAK